MSGLNDIFGNVYQGPWSQQAGFAYNANAQASAMSPFYSQNAGLAQAYASLPCQPVPTPEEMRQYEITTKNARNYRRWLERILRDPLSDCIAATGRNVDRERKP